MLRKYPRTRHLEGSRRQPGDEDLDSVAFSAIAGCHVVVEEKVDGANAGVSFDADGSLLLQSRGHFLTGGPRERQFARFKAWAAGVRPVLWERLGARYVLYGEWLYAKHTVFYDALPHFFCEFDVLDRETGAFLSTPARARLLEGTSVVSVPVLHSGPLPDLASLTALLGPSTCRTPRWRDVLVEAAVDAGLDPARVVAETDRDDFMEGLYIKVEVGDETVDRYKWVRPGFLTAVLDSGSHWASRPVLPNRLGEAARGGL
ncbi:RNA ligase family protein [Umezawaea sp. Da 62-37]|uniref:RNA ligase family protein n=1 Tax=Umezawaea sp. Da 62-37 TaxID=3075927 RepID=UPI0028F6FB97|nr:RNA ligase family protein [Umezawaea sp. Da 62-37]WNV83595.1 RNA ligase family protein [Umezawaea sp. Da 62-37]